MGLTYILDIFRAPETSIIADLEAAIGPETVPLRAYGPYRSEYGRLGEFPNLPPLLVRTPNEEILIVDQTKCMPGMRLEKI